MLRFWSVERLRAPLRAYSEHRKNHPVIVARWRRRWARLLAVSGASVLVSLLAWVVVGLPRQQAEAVYGVGHPAEELESRVERSRLENEYRRTSLQVVTAVVILFGLWVAWRRSVAAERQADAMFEAQQQARSERFLDTRRDLYSRLWSLSEQHGEACLPPCLGDPVPFEKVRDLIAEIELVNTSPAVGLSAARLAKSMQRLSLAWDEVNKGPAHSRGTSWDKYLEAESPFIEARKAFRWAARRDLDK